MRWRCLTVGTSALVAVACSGSSEQAVKSDLTSKTTATLTVSATEFQPNGAIPTRNSGYGQNVSPAISWAGAPAKAKSIVIIVDDPDAHGFVHWVIYNIPGEENHLPPGLPSASTLNTLGAAMQGKNSAGGIGYFGPKPPPGKPHHYHFHVYAVDRMLPLKPGATRADVLNAMSGKVLAQGELVGIYQRK